jgi:hypothetical protein
MLSSSGVCSWGNAPSVSHVALCKGFGGMVSPRLDVGVGGVSLQAGGPEVDHLDLLSARNEYAK